MTDAILQGEPDFLSFCSGLSHGLRQAVSNLESLDERHNVEQLRILGDQIMSSPLMVREFGRLRERLDAFLEPVFEQFCETTMEVLAESPLSKHKRLGEYCALMHVYAQFFWFIYRFLKRGELATLEHWLNELKDLCDRAAFRVFIWVSRLTRGEHARALKRNFQTTVYDFLATNFKEVVLSSHESAGEAIPFAGDGNPRFYPYPVEEQTPNVIFIRTIVLEDSSDAQGRPQMK